jgi:hypothetical protein
MRSLRALTVAALVAASALAVILDRLALAMSHLGG